jgi:MarR family transcriptional regulator for hemolysin
MAEADARKRWDPEASASFWINRASRALLKRHESRLRPLGFGMSQMPVLQALEQHGPLSQKELARRAKVEQPTMAEMLARMERDGVVERSPDPDDGRASLVSLTRRARLRLEKGRGALMRGEGEAIAGLSAAEKATLVGLLRRVVESLDAAPVRE